MILWFPIKFSMQKILEINNLTRHFGRIRAVDNLSLIVEEGQIFGLLGPNGSGKTTTLSIISGVARQQSGSYSWFGSQGDDPRARQKIGSLIEVPNFYPYLSLVNNLRIAATIKNAPAGDIDRVLKVTDLYKRRYSPYRTLSLGMKQRLAIASVLLGDPQVMVLDEPANGLDPGGIAEVREIISREAGNGKTVVLASHILAEVEKVCTHVAVLKEGDLLASGRVDELLGGKQLYMLSASDPGKLETVLVSSGLVQSVARSGEELTVSCSDTTTAEDLNRFAFERGIVLTRLVAIKKSLESQFLELVK